MLWLYVIFYLWLTHALAYLAHEYAHAFTAWALGYKSNPLALDYGHPRWGNLIFLSDIDENVDYVPIFAAHRGYLASLIAVAGVLFGNGLFYLFARWLYRVARLRGAQMRGLFAFLLCLMNVGNFLSYVPIRTFATHADMATVEQGLQLSPWWVVLVLGIPFAMALWHFFARLLPDALAFVLPGRSVQQVMVMALCCCIVFVFFGSAGMQRYGDISHWLSMLSLFIALPLVFALCLWRLMATRSAIVTG